MNYRSQVAGVRSQEKRRSNHLQRDGFVQDAKAYQRLLDIAARADEDEAIRQGLDDVAPGRTRPVREFFEEFRRKHGIPRSKAKAQAIRSRVN